MNDNQLINSASVAKWYNDYIIKAENQKATSQIAITINGSTLNIPSVNIFPGTTIDDLVRGYHAYLLQNGPTTAAPIKKEDNGDCINFERVKYRNNPYMVQQWQKGSGIEYIVIRENGEPVKDTSTVYKKCVEEFEKKYPPPGVE